MASNDPSPVTSPSRFVGDFVAGCRATKWLVTTVIPERPVPPIIIRELDLTVNLSVGKWN
jgi:hypothetical protein